MRRSPWSRLFAALFAPWFAVVVAEPVPMHDCPVHSLHPAAAHAMAPATAPAASRDAMPGMDSAEMGHASQSHGHGGAGHAAHHQCCCLGACCASATATIVDAPQLGTVATTPRRVTPHAPPASPSAAAAEHVLPFANGPPATRV